MKKIVEAWPDDWKLFCQFDAEVVDMFRWRDFIIVLCADGKTFTVDKEGEKEEISIPG